VKPSAPAPVQLAEEETKTMKQSKFLSTVFAAALLTASSAVAQSQNTGATQPQTPTQQMPPGQGPDSTMSPGTGNAPQKADDTKFVKNAALGGLTEVELGKLAAQKASDPKVKEFAQTMVDDHTKANENLKQIASKSKIQVPDSLDSKHQSRIDKMSKLSGEEFDKAYVKDQLKDHQTDVREFTDEAQNGNDPNVKGFASSTLPTLQHHLEMVKDLNKGEKQMSKKD
jgi:putative membrane protein